MSDKNQNIISQKDLIRLLVAILRNWYIILIIPAISFVAAYFYTHRLQDVYAAKTQILLKAQETYDYQQQLSRGLGVNSIYGTYEYTASQMRVIKSANLLDEVLRELPLNVSYFIVGRLKVTEVYQNVPFKVTYDERGSNVIGTLFTLNIIDSDHFRIQYEANGVSKDKTFRFDELVLDDGLYIKVERAKNLTSVSLQVLSNIKYQFRINSQAALLNKYKSSIEVKNIDYTSIVEVTLKDEIAERGVAFLNILSEKYLESTVSSSIEINENTLKYIDRQLDQVTGIINDIEYELEDYKNNKDILNIDKEEDSYFNKLAKLDDEKLALEQSRKALDDLTAFLLRSEDVETLLPPSLFVANADGEISTRVAQLFELRSNYSKLFEEGTADNPKVKSVLASIDELKRDLLRYIDSQRNAVASQIVLLDEQIAKTEYKIKVIPSTQRELLNIERKLQVNEKLYDFLLSKRAETVIAKAGLLPETKIIEQARSVGVVYPDKTNMHRLGLFVGLGIAALIVFVRQFFFNRITNVGQLETSTNLPILGSIPKKKNLAADFHFTSPDERGDLIQAFRMLRTNLQFYGSANQCHKVLVTSLLPGEGKTFSTVNLAAITALADLRVLIIDFDLHKPRLHKALSLSNERGLSNLLIGQLNFEEVLQQTDNANLMAITSGPIPPNASELVLKKEVDLILEKASEKFDYVFLDTPPIMLISDGVLLMQKVDSKLFVLNSRNTNTGAISFIEKFIEENHIKGGSLILNEEIASKINYYYSRYGYGGYNYTESANYGK